MSSANTPRIELNPFEDPPEALEHGPYFNSNQSSDYLSSMEPSRPGSAGGIRAKDKKKVGFHPDAEEPPLFRKHRPASITLPTRITLTPPSGLSPGFASSESPFISHSRDSSGTGEALLSSYRSHAPEVSSEVSDQIKAAFASSSSPTASSPTIPRIPPRPVLRRGDSALSTVSDNDHENTVQGRRAREAHERGKRLELDERISSAPASRATSPARKLALPKLKLNLSDIPLQDFSQVNVEEDAHERDPLRHLDDSASENLHASAHKLVRAHAAMTQPALHIGPSSGLVSAAATPNYEREAYLDYVPKPERHRAGVLGALLKLYNHDGPSDLGHDRSSSLPRPAHFRDGSSGFNTPQHSPPSSGYNTPISRPVSGYSTPGGRHSKLWHSKSHSNSTSSLAYLVGSSVSGGTPISGLPLGEQVTENLRQRHEAEKRIKKARSSNVLGRIGRPRLEEEIRITKHIAETLARQKYLLKLCRALITYGAPTHRMETYMRMSARVLEVDCQFLYIPGCMICSFDDLTTHTTEVQMVRAGEALDLGKLRDAHDVYKDVLHDRMGVQDATQRIEDIFNKEPPFNNRWLVAMSGLGCASVAPFAFNAAWIDLPICCLLGCIVGYLQVIAFRSEGISNMFEILATIITSFLARAFASIGHGKYFCFSALVQSSIALILPGWIVLRASLELQSKSLVSGSTRMVYAIIYSLLLGFGITIGTVLYGAVDHNAVSTTKCLDNRPSAIDVHLQYVAVIVFSFCLCVLNQAKWRQMPIMMAIAIIGYLVNSGFKNRFPGNTQISATISALAIGLVANLHSRFGTKVENKALDIWEAHLRPQVRKFHKWIRGKSTARRNILSKKRMEAMESGNAYDNESIFTPRIRRVGYGLAAASMLPAILVQVPSGLAVSGSLLAGVSAADQIAGKITNGSTVTDAATLESGGSVNSVAFNVGYSVVQIAIGITVGLFASTLIVYPFGKRRSGLFSL
ncbi:DUF1212-domain-containing protein [Aureobasidium pullulans]|nr:DUF1212-domain-containing protein [Aureobasidium pullulans]THV87782.1 DUF1212-domain-containing protein [Aureobasidium pullulans]THV91808.1 DUF1212-domain-containing protein [Aureobasidium pullulans]THW46536.1 DUF1212-domain-containing protein [Aureobasidium pullulans]THW52521.1 DUF1212-domain-containing protein [Aureobasidium pullulans]